MLAVTELGRRLVRRHVRVAMQANTRLMVSPVTFAQVELTPVQALAFATFVRVERTVLMVWLVMLARLVRSLQVERRRARRVLLEHSRRVARLFAILARLVHLLATVLLATHVWMVLLPTSRVRRCVTCVWVERTVAMELSVTFARPVRFLKTDLRHVQCVTLAKYLPVGHRCVQRVLLVHSVTMVVCRVSLVRPVRLLQWVQQVVMSARVEHTRRMELHVCHVQLRRSRRQDQVRAHRAQMEHMLRWRVRQRACLAALVTIRPTGLGVTHVRMEHIRLVELARAVSVVWEHTRQQHQRLVLLAVTALGLTCLLVTRVRQVHLREMARLHVSTVRLGRTPQQGRLRAFRAAQALTLLIP